MAVRASEPLPSVLNQMSSVRVAPAGKSRKLSRVTERQTDRKTRWPCSAATSSSWRSRTTTSETDRHTSQRPRYSCACHCAPLFVFFRVICGSLRVTFCRVACFCSQASHCFCSSYIESLNASRSCSSLKDMFLPFAKHARSTRRMPHTAVKRS